MTAGDGNRLVSVQPEKLKFDFELGKKSFCDFKVVNSTENHIAFKVKTTSPKRYFVGPNTGIIQPWDYCVIRAVNFLNAVALHAQQEYPPGMQCKDKFLLQSTVVSPHIDVDELPPNTFTKDSGNKIEEHKLKVSYLLLGSNQDAGWKGQTPETVDIIQRLKEERNAAVHQMHLLQQELDMVKGRKRNRKKGPGFSFWFAVVTGLVGITVGSLLVPSIFSLA